MAKKGRHPRKGRLSGKQVPKSNVVPLRRGESPGTGGGGPATVTGSPAALGADADGVGWEVYDAVFMEMARGVLASARKDVDHSSPLEVELWVARLVGSWEGLELVDGTDPVELIGFGLVEFCEREASPMARVFCEALAAVCPNAELRDRAREGAASLDAGRVRLPRWAAGIGQARYVRSIVMDHELGDGHSIFNAFAYPGGDEHTVCVYIDQNLGGLVKDFFPGPSLAQIELTLKGEAEPGTTLVPMDPAEARARIDKAYRILDMTLGAPGSDEVHEYRLFADARVAMMPAGGVAVEPPELSPEQADALVAEFLTSPPAALAIAAHSRGDVEALARLYVDFAAGYVGGNPIRVSPVTVEVFMASWFPRKVLDADELVDAVADTLNAFAAWSLQRQQVTGAYLDDIARSIGDAAHEMHEAFDASSSGSAPDNPLGAAKQVLAQLQRQGIDTDDITEHDLNRILGSYQPDRTRRARPSGNQPEPRRSPSPDPVIVDLEMPNFDTRQIPGPARFPAELVALEALRVCVDVLDPDYLELAFGMIGALARKRPSPITRGAPEIWAGGVLYLLGQLNFLWDIGSEPHVPAKDLAIYVGASQASLSAKARAIRAALNVQDLDPRFMLDNLTL